MSIPVTDRFIASCQADCKVSFLYGSSAKHVLAFVLPEDYLWRRRITAKL